MDILKQLYILIKYKYDKTGATQAKRDTGALTKEVDKVGGSLDKLNKKFDAMGVAAVAAAGLGVAAYTRLNAVMVEFSGKAGMSIKDFRRFGSEANKIARETGAANESVIEQIQRIYSLGGNRTQASALARSASILESRNVVSGTLAVESAMALQNNKLGTAQDILQMVFAGAQTGPGNMPEYFEYTKLLGGVAGQIGGMDLDEIVGALTILASGGRMSTGASGMEEVISQLFRDPEGRRSKFYSQQTGGGQWNDMKSIFQEGGLTAFVRHMAQNFNEDDLFQLFGSKEAARAMATLMTDPAMLEKNIKKINNAAEGDAIGRFGTDTQNEFSVIVKALSETLSQLKEQFGAPFAKFFTPLLRGLQLVGNGLLSLNESTNGLLAWFVALGATLFALPRAFRFLRGTFRTLGSIGGALTELVGGRDGAGKDSKRDSVFDAKSAGSGFASGLIGGAAGFGIAAFFRNIAGLVSGMFGWVKELRKWTRMGIPPGQIGGQSSAYTKSIRIAMVFALSPVVKLLGILVGALGFSALYSKLTDWNNPRVARATQRDAQADHFRAGGASGDEPAPGIADIVAANRGIAEAERNLLFSEIGNVIKAKLAEIRAMMPDFVVKYMFDPLIGFFGAVFGTIHSIISGVGIFVREFFADPRAAIGMAWDYAMGKSAELDAFVARKIMDFFDIEPSDDANVLGSLTDQTSSKSLTQPTIKLTKEQREMFGITGDYGGHLNAPNVDQLILPTPPGELNKARPVINMEFNMGDINISGEHADDRFDTAKRTREIVREEFRNSADYIIQEMEALSP